MCRVGSATIGGLDMAATVRQAVAAQVQISNPLHGLLPNALWLTTILHGCTGHYVWYSLRLDVSEAPPIGSLDVAATVRQAVAVQVQISNPLHEALTFDLSYGSDQLVGPDVLALKPKESRDFEFFFAPLVEGDSQASVVFSSFRVGLCINMF